MAITSAFQADDVGSIPIGRCFVLLSFFKETYIEGQIVQTHIIALARRNTI